ncbi:hypothetical protein L6452_14176 [Arctium lappa]|uniref:Uncharacterized protein n=1 Tax=Arctium lappa TaxID=4217 RepID=A0ACB9CKC5_ARCLA|nr:hypothetical protein L6452_14176 [Arctium lappa]
MAGKDSDYRIFVGGLSRDITERQLENAFSRFGKVIDSQMDLFTRKCGSVGCCEIKDGADLHTYVYKL